MTNQTHTPDVPVMYYIRPNISTLKLKLLKMLNTKLSPSFCMASQSHICHTILQKCHTNDSHKGLYQIPGHEHLKVHSALHCPYSSYAYALKLWLGSTDRNHNQFLTTQYLVLDHIYVDLSIEGYQIDSTKTYIIASNCE